MAGVAAETVPLWQTLVALGSVAGLLGGLTALGAWSRARRRRGEEATSVDADVPTRGL